MRSVCYVLIVAASATSAVRADETVAFAAAPSEVGDVATQHVNVTIEMNLTARRGPETLHESRSQLERAQRRRVTATEVVDGLVVAAEVTFDDASEARDGVWASAPIAGKTYLCRREGEMLWIALPNGDEPPEEQRDLVRRAMQTLGQPSPLVDLLKGRSVSVGQRIEAPPALVAELFGMEERLGKVERFDLRLAAVESDEGDLRARFDTEVDAAGSGAGQMRLLITGSMTIDAATCRVVAAEMNGPLAMSHHVGTGADGYRVDAAGKVRVASQTRYHAPR